MKNFRIISLFVLASLVISLGFFAMFACKSPLESKNPPPTALPNSYFPLQVGNKWHYHQVEVGTFTRSVTSEKIIDNDSNIVFQSEVTDKTNLNLQNLKNPGLVYLRYSAGNAVA